MLFHFVIFQTSWAWFLYKLIAAQLEKSKEVRHILFNFTVHLHSSQNHENASYPVLHESRHNLAPYSLKSVLILSSSLYLGFPAGLYFRRSPTNIYKYKCMISCVLHDPPVISFCVTSVDAFYTRQINPVAKQHRCCSSAWSRTAPRRYVGDSRRIASGRQNSRNGWAPETSGGFGGKTKSFIDAGTKLLFYVLAARSLVIMLTELS